MSKRANSEGSIYQRSDGRWVGSISLGFRNGKPLRKSYYGKTRKEVHDKLTRALRDHQQGLPVATDERQTLGQYLTYWLNEVVKSSVSAKTYRSYEQVVRVHLMPELGKVQLTKLSRQNIQTFLNTKQKCLVLNQKSPEPIIEAETSDEATDPQKEGQQGKLLSATTVRYMRVILRIALNQALRDGLLAQNVAALVKGPRAVRHEISPLSPEQMKKLLTAAKGSRDEAIYTVAVALGLRQGEILALKWDDVDFKAKTLTVRRTVQRVEGKLVFSDPKTEKSRRTLPLPEVLAEALKQHHQLQKAERLLSKFWQDHNLIFPSSIGTPMESRNLVRDFHELLVKAELPPMRFHDLRHTAATLMLLQGVDMRRVMAMLGHSQIALTANTYSHVMTEMLRDAADKMDDLLGK
jgi:integrase